MKLDINMNDISMSNIEVMRENEKIKSHKETILRKEVLELKKKKSKYSSFGGDSSSCSIEIPKYLKSNKI